MPFRLFLSAAYSIITSFILHEKLLLIRFDSLAVKENCVTNQTRQFGVALACADDKPLTTEQQQKLRSKYLFDDDNKEENARKRNMTRTQSLNCTRKTPEKTYRGSIQQNERQFVSSSIQSCNSTERDKYDERDVLGANKTIRSETKNSFSVALPPKCRSSETQHLAMNNHSNGIY